MNLSQTACIRLCIAITSNVWKRNAGKMNTKRGSWARARVDGCGGSGRGHMYAEQWNEYRKLRFMFWCVFLGAVPFVGLCWYLQDQILPGSVSSPVSLAPAIAVA